MSDPKHLRKHITETYFDLRNGLMWGAIFFPVVLVGVGLAFRETGVQPSLSAYYHTDPLIRDLFVGGLFALGILMHRYQGFGREGSSWWFTEDRLLNLAGVAAALVALIPMDLPGDSSEGLPWHGISAAVAFGCLAIVSWSFHSDTLKHTNVPGSPRYEAYQRTYRIVAGAMVVAPVTVFVVDWMWGQGEGLYGVLLAETAALWVFAWYWYVKGRELKEAYYRDKLWTPVEGNAVEVNATEEGADG